MVTAQTDAVPTQGVLSRAVGVIFSPGATFQDVVRSPRPAGILLLVCLVMGLATGDAEERDGGLASGLMTSAQQIGGAIGIAVMITIATDRTGEVAAGGANPAAALTEGFSSAFAVEAAVMLAAAVLAAVVLRARK